jgi:hypothetical protein
MFIDPSLPRVMPIRKEHLPSLAAGQAVPVPPSLFLDHRATVSEAKIDTGEMQPRYLPLNFRKDKGLPALKKGDRVEIVVNDQNLIIDIHLLG